MVPDPKETPHASDPFSNTWSCDNAENLTELGTLCPDPHPWEPVRQPTCSPITHCPAFILASSKFLCCFSEYFTPMSTPLCSPFVLACKEWL